MVRRTDVLGEWDVMHGQKVVLRLEIDGGEWKGFVVRRAGLPVPRGLAASYRGNWELTTAEDNRTVLGMKVTRYDRGDLSRLAEVVAIFFPADALAKGGKVTTRTVKGIKYVVLAGKGLKNIHQIIKNRKIREGQMYWRFAIDEVRADGQALSMTELGNLQKQIWLRVTN